MYSKVINFKRASRSDAALRRCRGVTLVELVVVLVLLGIIAAVAGMAVRDPIRAYLDTTRRAELTEIADTALRRMARDIRRSLPNSPRVTGADPIYLEFLMTRTGGRYRAQGDGAAGDVLNFSAPDTIFDSLGGLSALPGQAPTATDIVVVYNLFATGLQANAYTYNQGNCVPATTYSLECNSARVTGTAAIGTGTRVNIVNRQFPFSSPGNRFHVVEGPVTYICDPGPIVNGDGTGTLRRVSNYTITLAQPVGAFGGAPVNSLLARNVSACEIIYNPLVLTQTLGLVSIQLTLTRGGESVRLYHEVHVSNIP